MRNNLMLTNSQFQVLVNELAEAKRSRKKISQPTDLLSVSMCFLLEHLLERPVRRVTEKLLLNPLDSWMSSRIKKAPQRRASM